MKDLFREFRVFISACAAFSFVSLTILGILSASAIPVTRPVAAKENWTSVKTRNFTFVGNASEREIRRIASQLEQFHAAFTRLFTQIQMRLPAPTRVIVFKNDALFRPYKPLYEGKPMAISGFIQSGSDVNYIALAADARGYNPYDIVYHEYVHVLTRNNTRGVPVWFSEGLAEYYSTFEVADNGKRILLGKPLPGHIELLRDRTLLPLETLFAVDRRSPHYNETDKKSVFYAESWALIHYFMQSDNGARRQSFLHYLNLLASGASIEEGFRQALKTDYATLETDLKNYISRRQYNFEGLTLGEPLSYDAAMAATPLTDAEAQYYLGDLLLHNDRLEEAEQHLQQAMILDGKLAAARASLGLLRARQKRFGEARQHLAAASAAASTASASRASSPGSPGDPLVHYYRAWALSREYTTAENTVSRFPPDAVQVMRAELRRTIELAPEFAEAHRLMAFVGLIAGEDMKEAEAHIRRAQASAPGESEYDYLLARILIRQERFAAARAVLAALATGVVSPGLRARAQEMLGVIDQFEAETARRAREAEARSAASSSGAEPADDPQVGLPPGATKKRRLAEGEKQVEALLVNLDCTGRQMTLTLKTGAATMLLRATSAATVEFVSFTPGVGAKLTCGPQPTPSRVRVTYRPLPPTKARVKIAGEPVTVEFLK